MQANTFGKLFSIHTFGESHGKAIGVVIDGCPAGLPIDIREIQADLDRRRPGQSALTTPRKEADKVEILSGVFDGKSLGTPIALLIYNNDQKSKDYSHLKDTFRPGHADFTYEAKFGLRDYRGGGRASARETAARVAAGAVAKMLLKHLYPKLTLWAWVQRVQHIEIPDGFIPQQPPSTENIMRCPHQETAEKMIALVESIRDSGNTVGGSIRCAINHAPKGLGNPVMDKLEARLAQAMLSLPAAKSFEIGSGLAGTYMTGKEHNDIFTYREGEVVTETNYSGGVQGGISNGMPIVFTTGFKPVSTIMQKQPGVDKDGKQITLEGKGRHDPCVLPRAVPIVEAMAALVLADEVLRQRSAQLQWLLPNQ